MATAKCFMCHKGYETVDPDDIAGDGKCVECKTRSKQIALRVDIEMAEHRRNNPLAKSAIREIFTEEQIRTGLILDPSGRIVGGKPSEQINIKSLGINPHD